jgi:hypothetical protein
MKKHITGLMMITIAMICGAAQFLTSEQVQRQQRKLEALEEKISFERDAMRVLNAEWAYLNRPDRLEDLAKTYLTLSPGTANKVVANPDAIPEPMMPVIPGMKPDVIPASFTANAEPAPAKPVALVRPPSDTPKPASHLTFNQLINRVADGKTQP